MTKHPQKQANCNGPTSLLFCCVRTSREQTKG